MHNYLSKKYSAYSKEGRVFTIDHVCEELLCCATSAGIFIKKVLGKNYALMSFEQFHKVVAVTLDLE